MLVDKREKMNEQKDKVKISKRVMTREALVVGRTGSGSESGPQYVGNLALSHSYFSYKKNKNCSLCIEY